MKKLLSFILILVLTLNAVPLFSAVAENSSSNDLNNAENWATYNSKNTTSSWWAAPKGLIHNGKQSIGIVSYSLLVSATNFSVTANTDYELTFAYCGGPTSENVFNSVGISTLKDGAVTFVQSGDVYASDPIGAVEDWTSVSILFNSGNNTELEFYAYPAGSSSSPTIYLADFAVKEANYHVTLNNASSWTAFRQSGTVVDHSPAVASTAQKGGRTVNTVALKQNALISYVSKIEVNKNHLYRISFDYYAENMGVVGGKSTAFTSYGVAPLVEGSPIFRTHQTTSPAGIYTVATVYSWEGSYDVTNRVNDATVKSGVDALNSDNWYTASFEFISGNNEAIEFYVNPATITGNPYVGMANFVLEDLGEVTTAVEFKADSDLYKTCGALTFDEASDSFKMDYIGSGIEFTADISGEVNVGFKIPAIATYKEYDESGATTRQQTLRFKVWVDGVQQKDLLINTRYNLPKYITVASGINKGIHTIKLVRATETTTCRNIYVTGIAVNGTISAVAAADRPYIEVYGDSISSGYGNIASGNYTSFNNDPDNYVYVKDGCAVASTTAGAVKTINTSEMNFEDGTKTYAYMAAEAIGADIGVFSKSGLGITVYGGKAEENTETMTNWYPGLPINKDADYVIINHITNDSKYYNSAAGLTKEGLADAYADFIATVRADHTNAKIIVVYGMMPLTSATEDYYLTGEEVVLKAVDKAKQTDSEVYALMLPAGNDGGASHPSEAQHIAAAEQLVNFINGLSVVETQPVAGIRAESTGLKQGIRVKNTIQRSAIDDKNIVTYGVMAVRKGRLSRGEVLTFGTDKILSGVAYNVNAENGFKYVDNPILRDQTETENTFSGVLINIPQAYYNEIYAVRSFAIDGDDNLYYGEVVEVCVFDVVYSILAAGGDDVGVANSIVNEIIKAKENDSAGIITTYAQWCAQKGYEDKSAAAK